ncbi:MAG TPA: alpha-E domain-containing protein, partial [Acidimicrobiia bacterium]|nr:alpha-E domain-containing protein [Acidimicrobiia bacterium]
IITYRRRYRSHAHLATMLDLLLLDPDNPRSLAHQLDLLLEDVRALPAGPGAPRVSDAEKHALETSTTLRLADTAALAAAPPELTGFLTRVIAGLHATADAVARANFTEQLPQRSVLTPADPAAARVSRMFL